MSMWKSEKSAAPTGLLDKNGVEICLNDILIYTKRVKARHIRMYRAWEDIPGHSKLTTVKVLGFGHIVKRNKKLEFVRIDFINVKNVDEYEGIYRIYRTDKTEIIKRHGSPVL